MRLARVEHDAQVHLGIVDGVDVALIATASGRRDTDLLRHVLEDDGLDAACGRAPSAVVSLEECRLLAPLARPRNVIGVGFNYAAHGREFGRGRPEQPTCFSKLPSTVIGPGDTIRWHPSETQQVDYEGELAVVIGRRASRVPVADALDVVLGYTVADDVTARDVQFGESQWMRGKSFDSFCPLGPWVVSRDDVPDPQALAIRTTVNDEVRQQGCTADMTFSVADLVSFVSRFATLEPGDVLLTGTPPGVGYKMDPPVFLRPGDVVAVTVESIGTLANVVGPLLPA